MREKNVIAAIAAIACPLCMHAQGVDSLYRMLSEMTGFHSTADFEVWLPSSAEPVVYKVELQADCAAPDSLAPADYLIRWQADAGREGFSAYFSGNHFRYRNDKLLEYHAERDQSSFVPDGPGSEKRGVQQTAQFADLLPQFIAGVLDEMMTDSSYRFTFHPDTIVSGRQMQVVDGVKLSPAGTEARQFSYVFHPDGRPASMEIEHNPATISEQTVSVTYSYDDSPRPLASYTEDALMALYPEVFEKYRHSTFRADGLAGKPMPSFSCRTLASGRMEHTYGDAMPRPTLFVFLDPGVNSTAATVADVRSAASQAPVAAEIVWVFTDNRTDTASEILGDIPAEESALISAHSLVRDCGITLYPTLIMVGADGIVKNIAQGYNQDLLSDVIQNITLSN